MAQDSTRRLLKVFGIAVTNLEDALEAALAASSNSLRRCISRARK